MLAALIVLLCVALVLVFNSIGMRGGKINLNLVFFSIDALKSIIFLGFIVVGVIIGLLLK